MKEVLTAYVPDGEFSELAIELTASNPPSSSSVSQSVNSSLSLPNPTDPLPPGDVLWQPWWNLVPGWRLTTPNKVIISFFHDPTWEFETILGAAFSAFAASQSAETAFPAGITVSDALTQRLATLWDETKICSGYPQGEFGDLAVYLMPPVFPCGDEACSGYFSAQNLLKTGDQEWIVKHEFIHYLLWRNTGDADGSHTNSLFKDCVFD
ncbi:MAG: hypothetical protein HYT29_01960 [Parcubacteria group bacterium]|nr:hypothetical protein [Parcubacteria group bacterium]